MHNDRIRLARLHDKIVSADEAAKLFADGMTVGMSGFTRAGDCKAVPVALAARAKTDPLKITLITGASLGNDIDKILSEANVLAKRMPFQSDATLRGKINRGEVMFIDQHLSETVEQLRSGQIPPVDIAVVEASAFTRVAGQEATEKLLRSGAKPTAIFGANDLIALGALDVLNAKGIVVPREMSLVGHNDMPLVDLVSPPLTTVRVAVEQMSEHAAALFLETLRKPELAPSTRVLMPSLVVRKSTAAI